MTSYPPPPQQPQQPTPGSQGTPESPPYTQQPYQQQPYQPQQPQQPWGQQSYQGSIQTGGDDARRRRGKKMLIWGLALMLLSLPLAAGLVWWGVSSSMDTIKSAQTVRSGETVHLEAGDRKAIWAELPAHDDDEDYAGTCTVEGTGARMTMPNGDLSLSAGSKRWVRAAEVVVSEPGDYAVTCTDTETVKVSDADKADDAFGGLFAAIGGGVLGALVFVPGLILAIMGAVRRKRS